MEIVREGEVNVLVPKLSAFVKERWEYAPSKAPVFYNPVMELNRDVAVVALQAYQRMVDRDISICEPLAGCGIRGVRFAVEVNGVRKVVMNDINPKAYELVRYNVEKNGLSGRILVANEDANLLLSRYAAPRKRFDFIDIDPFGSPVLYTDSAIRALRNGGLLALTATDMAPLCGVYPRACLRKYGGYPLRTEYCHELAVRLLIGSLATTAAKYDVGIKILFSHSTDHYIRVYALIRYGAKQADKSLQRMGYILHCFTCLHREPSVGLIPPLRQKCVECGSSLNIAGPLWLGEVLDKSFCSVMRQEAVGKSLGQKKRVLKLLSIIQHEADAPVTYHVIDKICDKLDVPVPSLAKVIDELTREGYQAIPTHFNSRGIKTDASAKKVREVVARLTA